MLHISLSVVFFFVAFALVFLICFAKLLEHYVRSFWIDDFKSKHVFITGCDCGFGNLLAKKLDRMGVSVFAACLTDQGMTDLQEQCSSNLKVLKLNVSNDIDIEKAVQFVEKNIGPREHLWSVVNNAGIITTLSPAEWHQKSDYEKTIRVNLLGSIMVTTKFLPLLRKSRGRVINMASIVCMIPMPNLAAYTVSKAGLDAFSDVLRRDMYSFGVSVHTIYPTGFRTNICPARVLDRTRDIYYTNLNSEQKEFYKTTIDDLMSAYSLQGKVLDTDFSKVTNKISHALFSKFPKTKYWVGPGAVAIFWPLSLMPYWILDFIFKGGPSFTSLCLKFFKSKDA